MEPRDSMPSNGAPESLKADCSGGYARSGERTIRRNGADRERTLNTRLKLTSGPAIARPLVREPRLSCCTPPIPQVGQEAPLGVQHAHLAEALHTRSACSASRRHASKVDCRRNEAAPAAARTRIPSWATRSRLATKRAAKAAPQDETGTAKCKAG